MQSRLRAHGSGSILDLFSFRSDPYRSRVDANYMDPIQSTAGVRRGFLLRTGNPLVRAVRSKKYVDCANWDKSMKLGTETHYQLYIKSFKGDTPRKPRDC